MALEEQQAMMTLDDSSGLPLEVIERHESQESSRYTAGRLETERPQVYRAVVALLRAGYSPEETAQELGMHFYTVNAVSIKLPEVVAVGKKTTARLAHATGRRALEKIHDFVESHSVKTWNDAKSAAMVAGITIDKGQVLDGEPTEIQGHTSPNLLQVGEMFRELAASAGKPVLTEKNGEQKSGSLTAGLAVGPGFVAAAVRSEMASEADKEADKVLQSVDNQKSNYDKHLIDKQGEAEVTGGDDAPAVVSAEGGRGGSADSSAPHSIDG
ncbi:MAG: hypothetical protein AAGJ81_10570 [Verrucomicrobiota bacterium]